MPAPTKFGPRTIGYNSNTIRILLARASSRLCLWVGTTVATLQTRNWQTNGIGCRLQFMAIIVALVAWPKPSQPADSAAQVQKVSVPASQQIVGTWQLVSIYEENAGGEDIDQFGVAPKGQFIADKSGHFSFQIISLSGRRYSSRDGLAPPHRGALVDGMTYFGTYYLDAKNDKLILQAEYCLFRSCDRSKRIASINFRRNEMELVSAAILSLTSAYYSQTVWRRVCCE